MQGRRRVAAAVGRVPLLLQFLSLNLSHFVAAQNHAK
jgi:hypothetical protein